MKGVGHYLMVEDATCSGDLLDTALQAVAPVVTR
jgi:hypothetical protein